jgi:hypothetical protein
MKTKIKNEHSSEFLKKMHHLDIIFNDKEEKEYSEQQLLIFADRFANQRVIEELNSLLDITVEDVGVAAISIHTARELVYERAIKRIKELKQ